jgi:hypothetical protein
MLKENDYFVVRSIVVLLGVLGRRKNNPEVRFCLERRKLLTKFSLHYVYHPLFFLD